MIKVLIATTNPGKIDRYTVLLGEVAKALGEEIQAIKPQDLGLDDIKVKEDGTNEMENAIIKAQAFFEALRQDQKIACLAGDSGTYLEGVEEHEQPGMYGRRITGAGEHFSLDGDQVMIKFYQDLCHKYGGTIPGYYLEGHCLYFHEPFADTNRRDVTYTDKVVGHVTPGFPVMSMWKGAKTGKYKAEMTQEDFLLEMSPITESLTKLVSQYLEKAN